MLFEKNPFWIQICQEGWFFICFSSALMQMNSFGRGLREYTPWLVREWMGKWVAGLARAGRTRMLLGWAGLWVTFSFYSSQVDEEICWYNHITVFPHWLKDINGEGEKTQKIPSWFILIYGREIKHIISPSWNMTGINNPIKSNTVQLYLNGQCPNDFWEGERLPPTYKVNKMLVC